MNDTPTMNNNAGEEVRSDRQDNPEHSPSQRPAKKSWIHKNRLYFFGMVAGAFSGFLYWKNIGCAGGTCSITSSPLNSTIYFAGMGALLAGLFISNKNNNQ